MSVCVWGGGYGDMYLEHAGIGCHHIKSEDENGHNKLHRVVRTEENAILRVHLRDLPESHCIGFIFSKLTCQNNINVVKYNYVKKPNQVP